MTLRLAIVGVGDVAQRDYLPELGRLADRVDAVANLTPFSLHDLHLLDVVAAACISAENRAAVRVDSSFEPLDLRLESPARVEHLHDHTRPSDEQ